MKFPYDISVIVPVYNAENFVEPCMECLIGQTIGFSHMEVLLINDGSTDSSEEICRRFANQYENICLISQENQGVSAARNAGIQAARGKYIMFLDSDDTLSDNAAQEIVSFFDMHYEEIDLLTYRLYYRNERGSMYGHTRYEILNETGIYDLEENIHIAQSSMNVCVKNRHGENRLFNTSLALAEDQFYIMEISMQKKRIGYVNEAFYFYFRHSGATTAIGNHPYYCFDHFLYFFHLLSETYRLPGGGLDRVAQALLLYNFNWRLKGDVLFPYHYEGEAFEQAVNQLRSYVNLIDDDVILTSPHVDPFHKNFFLRMKQEPYQISYGPDRFAIYSSKNLWVDEERGEIVFRKTHLRGGIFHLEGFLKCLASDFYDISLYLLLDRETSGTPLELSPSTFSMYKSPICTNRFWAFSCDIPLEGHEHISFEIELEGRRYPTKYYFTVRAALGKKQMNLMEGHDLVEIDFLEQDEIFTGFSVKQLSGIRRVLQRIKMDIHYFRRNFKGFFYRKAIRKRKREIWLYTDRHGVLDNGYYQFKHDFGIQDGIQRYYIVDAFKDKKTYFTPEERRHLVKFKSLRHKLLFLNSSKILTSFHSPSIFSPFDSAPLAYYDDLLHYEMVYLQHGILHARLVNLYAKERSDIDRIVVSSAFEMENLQKNYGYSPRDFIPSGMPRLNAIELTRKPERRILFSPSWRKNLIGPYIDNQRELLPKQFLSSKFYQQIDQFLRSKELADLLEQYDLTLDYKNHPIFEAYNDYFQTGSDRIRVLSGPIKMEEYQMMITDFSSIVFDFAYLERPVLYFVPDYEMFRAGVTHTYRELDQPLEEGFGVFTQTADELFEQLKRLIENNFVPDPVYQKRMHDFFWNKGKEEDTLYQYLMKKKD